MMRIFGVADREGSYCRHASSRGDSVLSEGRACAPFRFRFHATRSISYAAGLERLRFATRGHCTALLGRLTRSVFLRCHEGASAPRELLAVTIRAPRHIDAGWLRAAAHADFMPLLQAPSSLERVAAIERMDCSPPIAVPARYASIFVSRLWRSPRRHLLGRCRRPRTQRVPILSLRRWGDGCRLYADADIFFFGIYCVYAARLLLITRDERCRLRLRWPVFMRVSRPTRVREAISH